MTKILLLLLTMSFASAAECVDDATGSFIASGWSCDMVMNTMLIPCGGIMSGTAVTEECPVSCASCPADCDNNPPQSHGCCLPDSSLYITPSGNVFYNSPGEEIGGLQFIVEPRSLGFTAPFTVMTFPTTFRISSVVVTIVLSSLYGVLPSHILACQQYTLAKKHLQSPRDPSFCI